MPIRGYHPGPPKVCFSSDVAHRPQYEKRHRPFNMISSSTLILVLLVGVAVSWLYLQRCRYWAARLPKTMLRTGIAYPLAGNLYQMLNASDGILEKGLSLARKLGVYWSLKPVIFWMGELPFIITMQAEDVESLLGNPRELIKPDLVYGPVRAFFGNGLIGLNGEAWQHHRKVLTPVFHFKILERYAEVFERRGTELAQELLDPKFQGVQVDALPHMCRTVSHTICETAFGMSDKLAARDEVKKRDAFIEATETAFKIIEKRVMKPWLMVDELFRLSPLYAKQRKTEQTMIEYAMRIIRMKKSEIAAEDRDKTTVEDDTGVKKKVAFLDLVLRGAPNLLSEDEIIQEVRTLVTVQQTTATTLAFIFVMLAIYPEVQEQVYKEVVEQDKIAKDSSVYERLNELKFLERVIKETMRLYPVTSIFARQLKEKIAIRDHVLPAGIGVFVFVFLTHRDKRFYGPDPEKFDPDHFLPERCRTRHPYAYVPFSAGPRNCIGQKHAMLQMKAVVSSVVRKLRIFPGNGCRSQEELRLDMDTFLHIRGGFNVRFKPRE